MPEDEVIFRPLMIDTDQTEIVVPGKSSKVILGFETIGVHKPEEIEKFRRLSLDLVENGYSYLIDLYGPDLPLSDHLSIVLTRESNHRASGALIHISAPKMENAVVQGPGTWSYDMNLAQITHEITHNLVEDEALPMLVEFIRYYECGHGEGFKQLIDLVKSSKLPEPYLEGLEKIQEWLGEASIESLLEHFLSLDIQVLRQTFKTQMREYIIHDPELGVLIETAPPSQRTATPNSVL